MKFVNVGFNNMINVSRIVAVVNSESAPAKRLAQDARDAGKAIDCTSGRKTRCLIVMDSDHVILSAIQNETITSRITSDGPDMTMESEDAGE